MKKNKSYFAVIFSSKQNKENKGYSTMAIKMENLAKKQKGFLGIESARDEIGITVSYWESLEAIKSWKMQSDHLLAQKLGREVWYEWYHVRVCKVEREYDFNFSSF